MLGSGTVLRGVGLLCDCDDNWAEALNALKVLVNPWPGESERPRIARSSRGQNRASCCSTRVAFHS